MLRLRSTSLKIKIIANHKVNSTKAKGKSSYKVQLHPCIKDLLLHFIKATLSQQEAGVAEVGAEVEVDSIHKIGFNNFQMQSLLQEACNNRHHLNSIIPSSILVSTAKAKDTFQYNVPCQSVNDGNWLPEKNGVIFVSETTTKRLIVLQKEHVVSAQSLITHRFILIENKLQHPVPPIQGQIIEDLMVDMDPLVLRLSQEHMSRIGRTIRRPQFTVLYQLLRVMKRKRWAQSFQ